MKILSLKFKNINSLFGEWKIDFTEPKFTDNGLFAITGKTGAGKSSILDAIALALYGRTPRVEITGQCNNVMTKGTTDCYSEIVFEVGGKIWKSAWKQEKNRNGNLKPVSRQIADHTNEIHADQTRSCDIKIVEILGLTFEQFTKVIMLAQGSFAAFLNAEKNEKGELLEQITGTEIYGEISRKTFERNKTEKENLEKIIVEIGAITILSNEEIENLTQEIVAFDTQRKQINSDLQTIEAARKWLADMENLYKQIAEAKQILPDLEERVETAKQIAEQSEVALKTAKIEKENSEKILVKVRELDIKIAEKEKALQPILLILIGLAKSAHNLTKSFENQKKDFEEALTTLQQNQDWLALNVKYEPLVEQFAAIENQYIETCKLLTDFNNRNVEFEKAKIDLETNISISKNLQTVFVEKEKLLHDKEWELKVQKEDFSELLAGKEIAAYQNEKENLVNFGIQIKNLIEVEKSISELLKEIAQYKTLIASSENSIQELSQTISNRKTNAENLKKQIVLLDENLLFAKTIQSLEDHRKSLKDGKPCPLCGALEHPYTIGNEPKIGATETELETLKKQEQEITHLIQQEEKTLTKLISDKVHAQNNREKAEKFFEENNNKRETIFTEIKGLKPDFSLPEDENRADFLEMFLKQKQHEYKQIDAIITEAAKREKLLKKLQDEDVPELQQAKQVAEKEKTEAETHRKLSEQNLENQKRLFEDAEKKQKEKNAELLKIFTQYDVENIETLKSRLQDWNKHKTAIETLKEQVNKLQNELALTYAEMGTPKKQFADKTAEKQSIETEKQTLLTERHHLFGDKQVVEEEKRLKKLIEKAETAKTAAEQSRINAVVEFAKNQAVIAEKEKEIAKKSAEKITDKTSEELQTEHDEKKAKSDLLSQEIGAKCQKINDNDENLQRNRKKIEEKELQQQICNKWGNLNELIGSQDGKKYRNFAQTLTFEHLIGLANHQLQKLSERYILKRVGDHSNPFDLSVIDKFQNCEERTAQNLSGGEKFIVSLSLALGLANMASKNMKIDTMFIDEGFGTLDSDYLEVALSALSNLQNEGKLIGVISHLSALKERIATHIEVIPVGNGYSRVDADGR